MRNKKVIAMMVVGLVAIFLATSGVVASPPMFGDASPVASTINYQGQLTDQDTGNPLSGEYDMQFLFYNALTGGSQVGSTITKNDVQVTNGLFSVKLDVNQADFNGQGLWLEVMVEGETLGPRQEILPVPYALSLKPGAVIGGAGAGDGSIYLKDANDETVLEIRADHAYLDIGGTGNEGDIWVRDGNDEIVFAVDGNIALVDIGGPGEDGDIYVKNAADANTFTVDGATGNVQYDGALIGAFPSPAYDSGWVSINQDESKTLTHNLGGNVDNYVVDVQFKSIGYGINNIGYGGREYDDGKYIGASWRNLTTTTIRVTRYADDVGVPEIRVRIWVYK